MAVPTPQEIKDLIAKDDYLLERAVLRIYERQTADEQSAEITTHSNKQGFNATDAYILSGFAKQILESRYPFGKRLSPRQIPIARRKMMKYSNQLRAVAYEIAIRRANNVS